MNKLLLDQIGLGHLIMKVGDETPWRFLETEAPKIRLREMPDSYPYDVFGWLVSEGRFLCVETPMFCEPPIWFGELVDASPLPDGTYVFRHMVEPYLMHHFEWSGAFRGHNSPESEAILACGGEWEDMGLMLPILVHIPEGSFEQFKDIYGSFLRTPEMLLDSATTPAITSVHF
jgi:hypothetical protein